jgi:hypothetical protein
MTDYRDDPEYQAVHDKMKSNLWKVAGLALVSVGLATGGAFLSGKNMIAGTALALSSLIPVIPVFKIFRDQIIMNREFEIRYAAKQVAKEMAKQPQKEIAAPQEEISKNWQQEVAVKDAPSQMSGRGA